MTKSPVTPQIYHNEIEDDEMDQVVTSNAVDYNTNDSKYMYDDFTENDYIATGDIVTTSTVTPIMNTQTHYTNSFATDGTNILNDQILSGTNNQIGKFTTGSTDMPVQQNTLNNHKTNLYCDSTAYDSTAYDIQQNDDESNKIGNNNYIRDQMYNDRFLDSSGNIVFNQNQPVSIQLLPAISNECKPAWEISQTISLIFPQDLDPNEVYREDYEEDVIQNQGLQTG